MLLATVFVHGQYTVSTLIGDPSAVAGTGTADGTGTSAKFNDIMNILLVPGTPAATLYACDSHSIRRIDIATKTSTRIVGGAGAGFSDAQGTNALL